MTTITTTDRTAELERKVDELTAQVAFLVDETRVQRARRIEYEELRDDLMPVATEAFKLASDHLVEIQDHVAPEDLLRLLKRLARNARHIERMLEQVESLSELIGDALPLGSDAFLGTMTRLDEFERRGYFSFLREGVAVADRIVTSFSEDDVRALGDNVVLILETVKEMTQPEVMLMLQRTAHVARRDPVTEVSFRTLLRDLRDPKVQLGMHRMLNVLRTMGSMDAPGAAPSDPTAQDRSVEITDNH